MVRFVVIEGLEMVEEPATEPSFSLKLQVFLAFVSDVVIVAVGRLCSSQFPPMT